MPSRIPSMAHRALRMMRWVCPRISGVKTMVLLVLCLQNSLYTVLRRYSQGVLRESYSKYEVLLVGEVMKMIFAAWRIQVELQQSHSSVEVPTTSQSVLKERLSFLVHSSRKMVVLALIYGAMNILSFVSLRNIGAGLFTIFAQLKILTTASFSALLLRRQYSWTQWRALIALMMGVLLFSEPIWNTPESNQGNAVLGTTAVLLEVTLSGFASIYFEKVIKLDAQQLTIWERNFQLALGSFPVYVAFIVWEQSSHGVVGSLGSGWSVVTWMLAALGAAGGLLVALSIKYGDSILKTLATTGAITLSSVLDHWLLSGPLTPIMWIAGVQVILSICNYTFDTTPKTPEDKTIVRSPSHRQDDEEETLLVNVSSRDDKDAASRQ